MQLTTYFSETFKKEIVQEINHARLFQTMHIITQIPGGKFKSSVERMCHDPGALRLPNKREIAVEGKETDGKKFFLRIRDMNRGAVLKR